MASATVFIGIVTMGEVLITKQITTGTYMVILAAFPIFPKITPATWMTVPQQDMTTVEGAFVGSKFCAHLDISIF